MTTKTDTQSPAQQIPDSHDLILVYGARVNNLEDVSVEIPKRRLTVFTGVSGSGKSSMVFIHHRRGTQRMIDETYSSFVEGFMATLSRPEVDVLEGLMIAIIVDQERMVANPRFTVGIVIDATRCCATLQPARPTALGASTHSFNVPSAERALRITVERGAKTKTEKATFNRLGGMWPRFEGMGSETVFELSALDDDSLSLNEGARNDPGYSMDGSYARTSAAAASSTRTNRSEGT